MARVIDKKAAEIANELKQADLVKAGFDPSIVIAIITAIIQLFKTCPLTPQQAERRAATPVLLGRLKLRRLIAQHASDSEDAEALFAAFLESGEKLTASDLTTLFTEV